MVTIAGRKSLSPQQTPNTQVPVAVDAMGGDHGPSVVVEGAVIAARELGIQSIIVGNQQEVEAALVKLEALNLPELKILHTSEVLTMDDSPSAVLRRKKEASVRVAFELAKSGEACGVVSPGNTGGMMAAGLFVSGTLPGIVRPAIASLIPRGGDLPPTVLLDSGANIDCNAQQLIQFALMGSCYARSATGRDRPRVGILSNGSEASKGNDITRAAYAALKELPAVDFIGYVEGRDICRDVADVIVCDGFVGNIVLKTIEGAVELVVDNIRHHVSKTLRGKIGLLLAKKGFRSLFREKLDPSHYGGAPLLGLNHVGVVCHGSSSSRAIYNAIRGARKFADQNLIAELKSTLSLLDLDLDANYQNGVWRRLGDRFDTKDKKKGDKVP